MTGQDFINLLLLKNTRHLNFSNKIEILDSLDEDFYFKDLKKDELKIFEKEYSDFNKAPYVLYYLINRDSWLKDKSLDIIESYISMMQLKSNNLDLEQAEKNKFGFEILGSSKKVLGSGILVPIKESYDSCIAPKQEQIEEFLKLHPGYWISLKDSIDTPAEFTKEELDFIKKMENI